MCAVKRCVSFYSYQDVYATKQWTLDQLFEEQKNLGVDAFEFITDQMMHKTPTPDEETLKLWDKRREQYGLIPRCNDIFINTKLHQDRLLTKEEGVEALKAEIRLAKRLGFQIIRMVGHTPWDIVNPALELAEQSGITLAFEIHGGMGFSTEATQKQLEEVKRINSDRLGLVIDASLFTRSLPGKIRRLLKNFGASDDALGFVDRVYSEGRCPVEVFANGVPAEMEPFIKGPVDRMVPMLATSNENKKMTVLDDLIPYIKHFHGKIFEAKNGIADGFDYGEIVRYLHGKGYNGYIATEYEGQRYKGIDEMSDEIETVREHQKILQRAIEQAEREG